MEPLLIYVLILGAFIGIRLAYRLAPYLRKPSKTALWFYNRWLVNAYVINRHRFIGPYTGADVFFGMVYLFLNALFIWYPDSSMSTVGRKCGILALVNLIFLYSSPSISFVADLLGIALRKYSGMHRAAGLMACMEIGFHVLFKWLDTKTVLSSQTGSILGAVGFLSLFLVTIISTQIIQRLVYPVFYFTHHLLVISVTCGLWIHLPHDSSISRFLLYCLVGAFGLAAVTVSAIASYRNGAFSNSWTSALIANRKDGSLRIDVFPGRPIAVLPGQYVNLWTPSLNPWSWFQCASFVVTSWSADKQSTLQLFAKCPSRSFGFTWLLMWRALSDSRRNLTLFSGPHGVSEPVSRYETVLLVANDTGILALKPYVEQLFHCVKKRLSKTRRLHLVWQVSGASMGIDMLSDMGRWVNRLLHDDIEDKTRMLQITIFDPRSLCTVAPGNYGVRGTVLQQPADFRNILEEEVQGHRQRLKEDVRDERGGMLVMSSASNTVRDDLQRSVKPYLQWVHMAESEYQPT